MQIENTHLTGFDGVYASSVFTVIQRSAAADYRYMDSLRFAEVKLSVSPATEGGTPDGRCHTEAKGKGRSLYKYVI
jgi:hypothetical protein